MGVGFGGFVVEVDTVELEWMSALADDIEKRNIMLNNKNVDLVFFHTGVNLFLFGVVFDWCFRCSFGWSRFGYHLRK